MGQPDRYAKLLRTLDDELLGPGDVGGYQLNGATALEVERALGLFDKPLRAVSVWRASVDAEINAGSTVGTEMGKCEMCEQRVAAKNLPFWDDQASQLKGAPANVKVRCERLGAGTLFTGCGLSVIDKEGRWIKALVITLGEKAR